MAWCALHTQATMPIFQQVVSYVHYRKLLLHIIYNDPYVLQVLTYIFPFGQQGWQYRLLYHFQHPCWNLCYVCVMQSKGLVRGACAASTTRVYRVLLLFLSQERFLSGTGTTICIPYTVCQSELCLRLLLDTRLQAVGDWLVRIS